VQVGCIAFLKLAVREALFFSALVPGLDEVLGDIDAPFAAQLKIP